MFGNRPSQRAMRSRLLTLTAQSSTAFCLTLIGCGGQPDDPNSEQTPAAAGSAGTGAIASGGTPATGAGGPGAIGPSVLTDPAACQPGTLQVGPAPVRRLSRIEYNNAVRDLLGDSTRPADRFVAEEKVLGFSSNTLTPVTELINEQYLDAAFSVAESALPNLTARFPCIAAGGEVCARQVLHDVARQAYRGALDATGEERLVALYRDTAAELDDAAGLQAGLAAVLTSPRFLYVVELGDPAATDAVVPLAQHEIAARLGFFLWRSLPDETLLAAVEGGQLASAEQAQAQARRMLADPRAAAALDDFAAQWLQIENIASVNKSADVYPQFNEQLKTDLENETLTFFRQTALAATGDVATLLTSQQSYVNRPLAQNYYGVASTAQDDTSFVLTNVNSDVNNPQRAGLLTQGSVLLTHAHPTRASVVHRGKLVREQFLCQSLPPPPPNVNNTLPDDTGGASTRDLFAQHASDPSCAGCHKLMDPIGNGFGHYDGMGKYLADENGQPIDTHGEVIAAGATLDGPFDGALELSQRLAQSGLVEPCFALQTARYALGRGETQSDACWLQSSYDAFAQSGFRISELIVAIAGSEAFRFRNRVDPAAQCL